MNWLKRLFRSDTQKTNSSLPPLTEQAISSNTEPVPALPIKPAIFLSAANKSPFSKLGRLPLMPLDLEWPTWNGKPQSFLAQLDLSEISQADSSFLPSTG
ncbi:DUF1963 domain-containing protein, partial [Puniceicoccaceae bacterium K14]|nr:DUF1963 domain-containing protein [Puniceicoccaceae bacterium K14]